MANLQVTGFGKLAQQSSLYPQESLLEVKKKKGKLNIGLPKEISLKEHRIGLTPEAVRILTNNDHEVWIEAGAGADANYSDHEYSEAGGRIVSGPKEVFQADVVLKIEPLVEEEFEYLRTGSTLISALNLPSLQKEYFEKLNKSRITAIGYELLEDEDGGLPVIRAMSEIAGSTVMLIAAEYLCNSNGGKGVLLGGITGIPPTHVVILGAGTVAEYAARTALGLGADVKIFDKHLYRLQRLKYALGRNIYTSIIDSDALRNAIAEADVVIGALRPESGYMPYVVSEEMVSMMNPDSVIIDVSIDQGGCFETSKMTTLQNPVYKSFGVYHYCVPNIASRVAQTASASLSNIFLPLLLQAGRTGGIEEMIYAHSWFLSSVYAHKGTLTNPLIAGKFQMRSKDLSLLLAARM